ncbi:MAG: antitoxin VbhA family protein [Treponema sp.]|nr:antitoxin VbhA family protein [Treponema sp.]
MSENIAAADIDYIIENVNFTMAMEDMPLTAENKNQLRKCLEGELDIDELIAKIITKYKKESAN